MEMIVVIWAALWCSLFMETHSVCEHNGTSLLPSTGIPLFTTQRRLQETIPDEFLSVPNLAGKYGYPAETHIINTLDNYFLKLHRIPHGKTCPLSPDKPVVLLQHGLFGSSADWVLSGPKHSLAYLLADAGYDVWLSNSRGNKYSNDHATLNKTDIRYWNFSWEEMGELDLAAVIDYILNISGQRCLYFIGHSMGSAMFFILMSSQPKYNSRIRASFHLAPTFYFLNNFNFQNVSHLTALGEFIVREPLQDYFERGNCHKQGGVPSPVCNSLRFLIGGYSSHQVDKNSLPAIISHHFAGTSAKAFSHYSQAVLTGELNQYDYGPVANLEIYGCPIPPGYNLTLVTSPVYIYYSKLDPVVGACEIQHLCRKLPNVVDTCETSVYTHMDFVWGINARMDIYDDILLQMPQTYGSCFTGNPVCGRLT